MFKKTAVLLVVGLCFSAQLCLAGGSITYKMNSIHPEGGDSFESHDINTYLSSEKFGMGVDTTLYSLDLGMLFWLVMGIGVAALKNLEGVHLSK